MQSSSANGSTPNVGDEQDAAELIWRGVNVSTPYAIEPINSVFTMLISLGSLE